MNETGSCGHRGDVHRLFIKTGLRVRLGGLHFVLPLVTDIPPYSKYDMSASLSIRLVLLIFVQSFQI